MINIKGLKINYITIGEGKPLLILHGWGSKSANWQKVGELLIGRGFKVIIPDLPGFGESQAPSNVWDLDDYADFVREFVKDLGLRDFYLLGHSFGGAVAVKYSLKFPPKKLFLVSAACFRKSSFRKKTLFVLSKMFKIFSFIPYSRKAFYKFIIKRSDYPQAQGVMKQIYLEAIKQDIGEDLNLIQIPTIIIWGDKDKVTPIVQAHLIKSKIKNSELKVIANADHDLNYRNSGELADLIVKGL
jgi:pimeloyl-ACP methyl ester carboxylesterase